MVKGQTPRESVEQRVLSFINQHQLVSGRRCLLVAVSGGQDSVCLLHVLVRLREQLGIKLHVAHLNHQLRGTESEADARYVSQLAGQLGIPATIEERNVKAYRARQRTSLEEAAREVRYTFFTGVAESVGADRVAVGHTTDDHIETILLHLVRGTGTRGLRGLQPGSLWHSADTNLTIIRPLLQVSRQETDTYCREHRLMPRTDTSNLSLSPLRNRIRHQLLPGLKDYNPRVAEALLRTARIAGDDLAFLEKQSSRLWPRIARRHGDSITLDKEKFLKSPLAMQRHLLRMAIEQLAGSLKDIETRHIEGIMAALTRPAGRKLSLPGGLVFTIEYDRYLLGPDPAALSPLPVLEDEFSLKIPGEILLPGWRVVTSILEPRQIKGGESDFSACLDFDKAGTDLVVRYRLPGDRFQPLGMSQAKKLGEFMIDARIPRAWRQRVPVVCSPRQILWVVGWRIDDRVKVTESTRRVLYLKFERLSGTCSGSRD